MLAVWKDQWAWVEAQVDVVISGEVLLGSVGFAAGVERLVSIGLGMEVLHNSSGLDGLVRL